MKTGVHELKARPHKAWGFEPQVLVFCWFARCKCARGLERTMRATLQVAFPSLTLMDLGLETPGFVRLCLQHKF